MMTPGMTPGSVSPVAAARPPALAGLLSGVEAGEASFDVMLADTPVPDESRDSGVAAKALPDPSPDPATALPDPALVAMTVAPPQPPRPAAEPPPETTPSPCATASAGVPAAFAVQQAQRPAPDSAETAVQDGAVLPATSVPVAAALAVPPSRTTPDTPSATWAKAAGPARLRSPDVRFTDMAPTPSAPKGAVPSGAASSAGMVGAQDIRSTIPLSANGTGGMVRPAPAPEPVLPEGPVTFAAAMTAPYRTGASGQLQVAVTPAPKQGAAGPADTSPAWPLLPAVDPARPGAKPQASPDLAGAATGADPRSSAAADNQWPGRRALGATGPLQPRVAEARPQVSLPGAQGNVTQPDRDTASPSGQANMARPTAPNPTVPEKTPLPLPNPSHAASSPASTTGGSGTAAPPVETAPPLQLAGTTPNRSRQGGPVTVPAPALLPLPDVPPAPSFAFSPVELQPRPVPPGSGDGEARQATVPLPPRAFPAQPGIPISQANPDQGATVTETDRGIPTPKDTPAPVSSGPAIAAQTDATPETAIGSGSTEVHRPLLQHRPSGDADLTVRATRAYQSAGMGPDLRVSRRVPAQTEADLPLPVIAEADPAKGRKGVQTPDAAPNAAKGPATLTLAPSPVPAAGKHPSPEHPSGPPPEIVAASASMPRPIPTRAVMSGQGAVGTGVHLAAGPTGTPVEPVGPAPAAGIPAGSAHQRRRPVKDETPAPATPPGAATNGPPIPESPVPAEPRPLWLSETGAIAAPDPLAVPTLSAHTGQTLTAPTGPLPSVPVAQLAPLAVAIATDPGSGAVEVALSPDELGRLHMLISTEGDSLRIAMTVERPDTLDLLRRHSEQLLADLRQAGFGGATLSFGQGSAGEGRMAGSAPTEPPPPPADAVHADTPPLPAYPRGQSTGHAPLDLRL